MPKRKSFIPFQHEDIELKQSLIKLARESRVKDEVEGPLAAALIYASFAEYLGRYLLENLRHVVYKSTFDYLAGVVYIDHRDRGEKMTSGKLIDELECFSFPAKQEILGILKEINISRNNLMHNLATARADEIRKVDEDIKHIADKTEELIERVEVVCTGLQRILTPQDGMSHKDEKKGEVST